jgi:hypothetical protein
LATSTAISAYFIENFIPPLDVITALNRAEVPFLLVGTHALGGWMQEPRATSDVDVLTASRNRQKVIKVLTQAFPRLEAEDYESGTYLRHRDSRQVLVDVLMADQPLLRAGLKHRFRVSAEDHTYDIPSLEMALAMKFALLTRLPGGDPELYQAAHDFILRGRVNPDIDWEKLAELGDLACPGGGKGIVEKVRKIRAAEKFTL